MSQIYQNDFKSTYSFSAAGAYVQWNGNNLPVVLVNLQIQYTRNTQPIFPVNVNASGKAEKINIIGIPNGRLDATGIIVPSRTDMWSFIKATGKSCMSDGEHVTMTISPFVSDTSGCSDNTKFKLKGVILTTVGLTMQGSDMAYVQMPLSFSFTSMTM